MRMSFSETYIANQNGEKQTAVETAVLSIEEDLAALTERLNALNASMSNLTGRITQERQDLLRERQSVEKLIETTRAYLKSLEANHLLGFATNKISDTDLAILEAQAKQVRTLRAIEERNLSQLINDAATMQYTVPGWKKWLRRSSKVLGHLVCASIAVAGAVALMTPGVNIVAAAVMVPTMFVSAAAFLHLHKAATTSAAIQFGPFPVNLTTPVPSTLGIDAAAVYGAALFNKVRVTNPLREETAENNRIAMTNHLIDNLKNKIKLLSDEQAEVKMFLLSVVKKADQMFNEGARGWFYETRNSKMRKASLILRETAKLLERVDMPSTVGAVLNTRINGEDYRFGELLNAQRNKFSFWKTSSATVKQLQLGDCSQVKERRVVGLDVLAAAI